MKATNRNSRRSEPCQDAPDTKSGGVHSSRRWQNRRSEVEGQLGAMKIEKANVGKTRKRVVAGRGSVESRMEEHAGTREQLELQRM